MDNTPDKIFEGEMAQSFFGSMVTSVGDITRNGFDEFLVGAFLNGSGENGTAYLYSYQPAEDTLQYAFYSPGWYLISVPLNLEITEAKSLFPGMLGDQIYIWDAELQQYIGSTEILPGYGFWLPVEEAFVTSIEGTPIYRNDYEFTTPGWHLVSSLFQTTMIYEPYDIPDNIVVPLYYAWDKNTSSYVITQSFQSQQANWVAVTASGKFILKNQVHYSI